MRMSCNIQYLSQGNTSMQYKSAYLFACGSMNVFGFFLPAHVHKDLFNEAVYLY